MDESREAEPARRSMSMRLMRTMSMGSMEELNSGSDSPSLVHGASWSSVGDGRTKLGNHQYADVDKLLSVSLGSLPKLLGLEGLTAARVRSWATGAELVSSGEEVTHDHSIPADLVTLSRWRCWLGAYNVDIIKPPENPRSKLQRASSKLIVLKRAGLLGKAGGSSRPPAPRTRAPMGGEPDVEDSMSFRPGCTLHVRNIGGGVEVENAAETSEYESPAKLATLLEQFGAVEQVTIRHRIQDGANTSWALVTMETAEAADKVVQAPRVLAGRHELRITYLDEQRARASTGEMQHIRTRHWIGIENKSLRFGAKRKVVSCGVRYWSWFCWCVAVFGLALVVLLSWYDALVQYPLAQTESRTRLPALNVTLTTPHNTSMTMSLSLVSERGLATEANAWNGLIGDDKFRSTRLGGGLLLAADRLVALRFEHATLPPGAQIDSAVLLLEAAGQDNRFLSIASTPLKSPRFGEAYEAARARQAPLAVGISASLDLAVMWDDLLSVSSLVRARTHEQVLWNVGDGARNQLEPHLVQSVDFSKILQELVDTKAWTHSSAITLLLEHASGEGQVLYTNSDKHGSVFGPMLITVLWIAVYWINHLFSSKENKMTVLDVQDNKEMRLQSRVREVIIVLNTVLLLISVGLIYAGLDAGRHRTALYWVRQIYLQVVAWYSLNLFLMWLMHFHVACNHLMFVGTQFWLSMSLQATRTVEVLMQMAHSSGRAHPLYKYRSSRGCMEHIALAMERQYVPRGQAIIQRSSAEQRRSVPTKIESAVHVIDHGEVIVTEVQPSGFSESRTLTGGEFFGEQTLDDNYHNPQLYGGVSYIWQAVAKHDATCWSLTRANLDLLRPRLDKIYKREHYRVCRDSMLFTNLDDDTVSLLESKMRLRAYADGQALVRQGEPVSQDSEFFIILSGRVEVVQERESGVAKFFGENQGGVKGRLLQGHGAFVGEAGILQKEPRSATLVARGSTECLALSYIDLVGALSDSGKTVADLYLHHYQDATIATRADGFEAAKCLEGTYAGIAL